MTSLISAELLKLRTTRSVYVAVGVALAFALAGPVFVTFAPAGATLPPIEPSTLAELMRGPARLAGGAVLLVGLLASAGEFRHGTVLTTRLAAPRPGRVLLAKAAALGLVGLAVGVLLEAVAAGSAAVLLASRDVPVEPFGHGVPKIAALVPALLALYAVLGVAIGSLLRNTAAAVGMTLVWLFVVEGALPVVTNRPGLAHWLPGGAVDQVLAGRTPTGQLVPAAAAALLLAYAVAVFISSLVADRAREL